LRQAYWDVGIDPRPEYLAPEPLFLSGLSGMLERDASKNFCSGFDQRYSDVM
jgi:hypothetical protein